MKLKPTCDNGRHNSGHLFRRFDVQPRKTSELTPYHRALKQHPQRQIAKLATGIVSFGFLIPIIVDGNGVVISGEARLLAAKELGLDEVPTILADHLTQQEIKAFRIADNRVGELAQWDEKALASELIEIIEAGEVEIDLTGFETAEIDVMVAGLDADGSAIDKDEVVPEPDQLVVTLPGDLWLLGNHRLLCASCKEAAAWAQLMRGEEASQVFTDPPYNVRVNGHVSGTGKHQEFSEAAGEKSKPEFITFLTASIGAMAAVIKDGGILEVCMDHRHLPELYEAAESCNLTVLNLCVWNKTNAGMGSLFRSQHELVLVLKKGKAPHTNNVQLGKHGRYRTNVWTYAGANSFGRTRDQDLADHPTVKPIALVADAILDVTHAGELVCDGFMGSGTTLLAAERTRRVARGTEIEGRYVDVAIRRWQKMTGKQAVLEQTGETFAQVTQRRMSDPVQLLLAPPAPPKIRQRTRPLAN